MNVVMLRGSLSRPPESKVLPSGDRLVNYDVTIRTEGHKGESVPVVWFDAPPRSAELGTGTEVVVVGRVRRRYFRTPSGTGSRTEVVAEVVLVARQRKRVAGALASAMAAVADVVEA